MDNPDFTDKLIGFLLSSPTPFHATAVMTERLLEAGYTQLREEDAWKLEANSRYLVTCNGSAVVAFNTGDGKLLNRGIRMAGAHTDSPCLKLKPNPDYVRQGYWQLGVEVYGGVLLNPWFDRDLSIAGRVNYLHAGGDLCTALLDFTRPVAVIPSLAIHLDREVNQNRSINAQTDIVPVLMQATYEEQKSFRELLKSQLETQLGDGQVSRVLDYELFFYDVQPPTRIGLKQEFLTGARLDNLLSCFVGMESLIAADPEQPAMLVCNDHEEVGSVSTSGAGGPFLSAVLERLVEQMCGQEEHRQEVSRRVLSKSLMISMDNAHGIHPNFADKHDARHGPLLNRGPVIKVNANQRYATNSENSAYFSRLCEAENIPVQSFVVRSDMGCGSTIGPIVAGQLGVSTIDVGVPTWGMHSIRETAGVEDAVYLARAMKRFFSG